MEEAGRRGVDPYAVMDGLAQELPPGAGRLLFLPYQMGDRTPHLDPNARGVFFGLSTLHGRGHLVRAVLEGVGYSLQDGLSVFDEMGLDLHDHVLCGGGARSALWRGILADIFGRDVATAQNDGGGAMGAAILAAVGAGIHKDVAEASEAMIRRNPPERFSQAHHAQYVECLALYRRLYGQLKDSFDCLQKLEIKNP